MVWFSGWTALVVGTLIGASWLGRDLWRNAAALFTQLGSSSQALGRLDGTATTTHIDDAAVHGANFLDGRAVLRDRVTLLRHERAERAARRAERHLVTLARWRAYSR